MYEHFHRTGTWPTLTELQRELASGHVDVLVRDVVRSLPEQLVHDPREDRIRLTVRGLAAVPSARPLMEAYYAAIRAMLERYRNPDVDPRFGGDDLANLSLDDGLAGELADVLREDAWPFGAGGDNADSWSFEISPVILQAAAATDFTQLLEIRFGQALDERDEESSTIEPEPLRNIGSDASAPSADAPIVRSSEDLLGRTVMAQTLARQATADVSGRGIVIGVAGPWGSGKTSLLNLAASEAETSGTGYVIRFDPWLFSSSEELVLRFLSELSSQLAQERDLADLAASVGEYAQVLAPLSALIAAPWLGPVVALSGRLMTRRRNSKLPPSAKEQRERVCDALRGLDRRLIVLVDDVDRLQAAEVRDVVRLVKLVGDFPNTTYVLAYDQRRVARALDAGNENEGQAFLEKIVQVSYDVPAVDRIRLDRALGEAMSAAVGDITRYRFSQERYTNLFADAQRLFSTLRDVRRYSNALPTILDLIGEEIELADVLALEAIRARVPDSFDAVVAAREVLTEPRAAASRAGASSDAHAREQVERIVTEAGDHAEAVRSMIRRLFPAAAHFLGGSHWGDEWLARWRREGLVAHPEVFAIYLQKGLPSGVLSRADVEDFLAALTDRPRLERAIDALTPDQLEGMFARLEHYEDSFPRHDVEVAISILFNARSRLERSKRGVFDLGGEIGVSRIVYRLLKRLEESEVHRVASAALPQIESLSERGELVRMIGYRPDSGHQLISEEAAAAAEEAFIDELMRDDAEDLAGERDLLSLFFWARSVRETAAIERVLGLASESDLFLAGLLRSAYTETLGATMGDAAVRRSSRLDWGALLDFIPERDLIVLIQRLDISTLALDERARAAVAEAKRIAANPPTDGADDDDA